MRTSVLLAVVLSAGWFSTVIAEPPTDNQVVQQVQDLFNAGFGRGVNALKDARRLHETARTVNQGDPRIDYAFGLVLLKQLKNKEALAQFESITRSHPDYWSGWQAVTWMHLVAKDYPSGYARLKDLARGVAASRTDREQRESCTEWIGQVMAALQKTVDTVKQRDTLLHEGDAIREILGPELLPAFARGEASVNSLHTLLEDDVQQTREELEAKQAKERVEKGAQVAKDLEASSEQREALKKTAEEWKDYLTKQVTDLDKQLARLEKDYGFLQQRVVTLNAVQIQVNAELALLDRQGRDDGNAGSREQRKAILGTQLLRSQVELDQSLASTMLVAQRAQVAMAQKATVIQQYEKATGQLVQRDTNLDKWQDRLQKEGEKLKAPAKGKPAPVTNRIKQLRTFRTYVDLDPALERERLLATFEVDAK